MRPWVGVDLDGTLAVYHEHDPDPLAIGPPVPAMVERVRAWLDEGREVRVFTARVSQDGTWERRDQVIMVRQAIEAWCREHVGRVLPVTCSKDWGMVELWDDRCVQVVPNTGRPIAASPLHFSPTRS